MTQTAGSGNRAGCQINTNLLHRIPVSDSEVVFGDRLTEDRFEGEVVLTDRQGDWLKKDRAQGVGRMKSD